MTIQMVYVLINGIGILILLGLIRHAWLLRANDGARPMLGLAVCAIVWVIFESLELLAVAEHEIRFWSEMRFLPITFVSIFWLSFAMQMSGLRLPLHIIGIMLAIPLACLILLATNDQHFLFWEAYRFTHITPDFLTYDPVYGPGYLYFSIYSYLLIGAGLAVLLRIASMRVGLPRPVLRALLLASGLPMVANFLVVFRAPILPGTDFTPIALAASIGIILRYLDALRQAGSNPITYYQIVENLPGGVIVADNGGRIVAINPVAARALGQPIQALDGRMLRAVFEGYPALRPHAEMQEGTIAEVALGEETYTLIIRPLLSDTTNTKQASSVGRVLVFRNISEQKRIERVVRTYERRYRALFERSNDAIFLVDHRNQIVIANPQTAQLIGIPLDELLGRELRSLFTPAARAEWDLRSQQGDWPSSGSLIQTTFQHGNGIGVPVEMSLSVVLGQKDEPPHIQFTVRDVSERVHTQEALSARVEQLALLRQVDEELSVSLDMDYVLMIALDAAHRLSGASSGLIAIQLDETLIIRKLLGAYPLSMEGAIIDYQSGIASRVLLNQQAEMVLNVLQDPDYVPTLPDTHAMMLLPLSAQERLIGLISLESNRDDVFSQERFELVRLLAGRIAAAIDNARLYATVNKQLNETTDLYEEMKRLEGMKTELLRIASHDLKGPLGIIKGYVELMRMDAHKLQPEHLDFLDSINRGVKRMDTILTDILSLERLQHQAIIQEELDLRLILEDITPGFEDQARLKNQVFVTDWQVERAPISGDAIRLVEALSNLIGNGIKYTPEGGHVTVALREAGDAILFEVIDTGYGIPLDRQARLFEAFYRARADGTEHIDGTGLGLHLVKTIVERHNGKIIFQSEFGAGSTFGFSLPRRARASRTDTPGDSASATV